MTDYKTKEQKELEKITRTMVNLDKELTEIDHFESDKNKHALRQWYAEKKAMHDVKKVLYEAKLYAQYDECEMEQVTMNYEKLALEMDAV
ncbi:hypothetical protein [Lactiplantibacillus plantarum]|uniref:hypothetical protein n=1 Tax=Lactiplantibacillus plantarum TaxID=1590 RepID=UPI001BACC86F|nr:hypothetical protein [Lactiplantibacillus plantarum]MBS0937614.1 hypothetical protein [Lactiplantibacillus plantarum]MBS0945346.1 hypothetical protein [Lactiplantibacillus plantarum]MBS0956487.1 hypothetical protein [Lactiplantibacillus plantarum]